MRIGIGYDIHRLVPSIKTQALPLGGVFIPCSYQVQAHSDGDVLLHALTDALLGALSLGDIGQWFSDQDPGNAGRSSSDFLADVLKKINQMGWYVEQLDSILFLEEPKISPHVQKIREHLASLLSIELLNVSVKAKTMEGLGAIGERQAIAAQVIVQLKCRSK